ncbi:MAG: hypothetical protein KatS3mg021_1823 [Fimbriimonadales bacterium]|nr:MAG: hypothetical protein KatS3mg021_0631 [Fimbriimonadales bacterium]GIV13541.1 MAG: hypothetical protein KatS3mg021_1823 [Fimbriimonadales bacterium]
MTSSFHNEVSFTRWQKRGTVRKSGASGRKQSGRLSKAHWRRWQVVWGERSGYLYFPEYLANFVPYHGYERCEVPLVQIDCLDRVVLKATQFLNVPGLSGYFECIFDDLSNAISFDFSTVVDYGVAPKPVRLELYTVAGTGSLAARWVSEM